MFLVAVIVSALLMSVFGRYPFAGPIISGMVSYLILKDREKSMLAAFISGSFTGIFAVFFMTIFGTLLGIITFGILGGAIGGITGTIMATGKIFTAIYFGSLGALGAFIGSKFLKKTY